MDQSPKVREGILTASLSPNQTAFFLIMGIIPANYENLEAKEKHKGKHLNEPLSFQPRIESTSFQCILPEKRQNAQTRYVCLCATSELLTENV